jgi:hypothetical protein
VSSGPLVFWGTRAGRRGVVLETRDRGLADEFQGVLGRGSLIIET